MVPGIRVNPSSWTTRPRPTRQGPQARRTTKEHSTPPVPPSVQLHRFPRMTTPPVSSTRSPPTPRTSGPISKTAMTRPTSQPRSHLNARAPIESRFARERQTHRGETLGALVRTKNGSSHLRYWLAWDDLHEDLHANMECVMARVRCDHWKRRGRPVQETKTQIETRRNGLFNQVERDIKQELLQAGLEPAPRAYKTLRSTNRANGAC